MSFQSWNDTLSKNMGKSSTLKGLTAGAGTLLGGIGGALGIEQNTAGQVVGAIGDAVSAIPGIGQIAGPALKLFSGFMGSKINQENVNRIQGEINKANSFQSNAADYDSLQDSWKSSPMIENFSKSDIGTDFLFSSKAKKLYKKMSGQAERANDWVAASLDNNLSNIQENNMFDLYANYAANGGPLNMRYSGVMSPFGNRFKDGGSTHGTNFSGLLDYINVGGTHEANPYGGVQMGTDEQGVPNLVEEGETIFDEDYVFSNQMKVPRGKHLRKQLGLPKKKKLTFAEASKVLNKEAEERPNDPISKAGVKASLNNLAEVQEEERQKKMLKELMNNPELLQAVLAQASQQPQNNQYMEQQPVEEYAGEPVEQPMQPYSNGGNIHIDKNKRGTFTAAASKHGMGVQEFASKVLSNKDNYSPAMVKKANFARNAAKWHALGGNLFIGGGYKGSESNPIELPELTVTTEGAYFTPMSGLLNPSIDVSAKALAGDFASRVDNSLKTRLQKANEKIQEGSGVTIPVIETQSEPYYNKMSWLRYAPAIGASLTTLTDALGWTNKPDYSFAEKVENAAKGIRDVRWNPVGNYLTYKPYDTNFALTRLGQGAAATRRALANSGRNALAANIIAADNNYLNSIGNTYVGGLEYNNKQKEAIEKFNSSINLANSEGFLKADTANMGGDAQRLNAIYQGAMMRQHERDAANASRAANFRNMLNSWGNIGREAYFANQINNMRNLRYRTNPFTGISWYDGLYT